jgi:hypothetical protein
MYFIKNIVPDFYYTMAWVFTPKDKKSTTS